MQLLINSLQHAIVMQTLLKFGLVKKAKIKANKCSIKIKGTLVSRPFHYEKFVVIPPKVAIVIREV